MRVLKQLVPVVLVAFIGGQIVGMVTGNALLTLVVGLVTAVLAILVYGWVVRWSEKRTPVELAPRRALGGLGLGLLIGFAWFGSVIINIWFLGDYRVAGPGSVIGALGLFGFMAAASVTEELMFRGVAFQHLEKLGGTWVALAVTAVTFGLWHAINPDATVWGTVSIMLSAGLALGAAFAATRSLWVTIGLHFGWNFAEAGIFGTEVSGNGASQGLLHGVTSGPSVITGGQFGPEASPYTVVFGLIMTVIFLYVAHRKGRLVPLRRSARATATATLSA